MTKKLTIYEPKAKPKPKAKCRKAKPTSRTAEQDKALLALIAELRPLVAQAGL